MATINCEVYRINFPKENLMAVLSQLTINSNFEPIEPIISYQDEDLSTRKSKIKKLQQKYQTAVKFLSEFYESKSKNHIVTAKDYENKISKSELEEFDKLKSRYSDIKVEIEAIKKQIEMVTPISDSDVQIASETELFSTKLLILDTNQFDEIKYDLRDNDLINLIEVKKVDREVYVLFIYDPTTQSIIDEIVKNKNLKSVSLTNNSPKTINEFYKSLSKEKTKLEEKLANISKKLTELAKKNLQKFQIYSDSLGLLLESFDLVSYVGYSFDKEYDFLHRHAEKNELKDVLDSNSLYKAHIKNSDTLHIDGWIVPNSEDSLKKSLNSINHEINIVKLDRDKLSDTRSSMKNARVFQPFETVTNLMGVPASSEVDPSPFVAPFFVGFFGFALGDAGYGIILTLASIYALTRMKLSHDARNGITLMMYCGISTIFFGALTGGWFGADLEAIGPVGQFLAQFKVFDIASNIILVLIGSLVIGFIHQIFGLLLSMYSFIKNGEIMEAIWKPGTWILFLFTLIGYFGREFFGLMLPWTPILVTVIALFAWGQGSGTKNVLLRPLKGLAALFEITSYLSNTLSYARLLALALATGVIASVVNLLAVLFSGNTPVVSQIIAAIILVLGHGFNLILNLVGTFINVVRLHLVEFFPHFFEAKGVSIQPLTYEPEYIIIDKDISGLDIMSIAK